MKTFAEIIETIKSLKGIAGDGEVAVILDIKPKTLATSKLRNSIPFEELTSFCNKEKVSLNWLLTGEGEMKRGESPWIVSDNVVAYNAGDADLKEICEWLRDNPGDKKAVSKLIKLLKSKKEYNEVLKEVLSGPGFKGIIEEG